MQRRRSPFLLVLLYICISIQAAALPEVFFQYDADDDVEANVESNIVDDDACGEETNVKQSPKVDTAACLCLACSSK